MSKRMLYTVVMICAMVTGLAFGFGYGSGNDVQYLIEGLRLADPTFLEYDWFASQTTHYHHHFSYIVYALLRVGAGPWTLAILNCCLTVLGMFFVFKWVQAITAKHALPTFLFILCLVILFKTRDVANSLIFDNLFQSLSFGGACFLAGISCFISGQFLLSGIFLAIGGWFHTNFLLLGFPLFFCGHVGLGENALMKRLLQQLGPSLLILAMALPELLSMATSANGAEGRRIFFTIRSPDHYLPLTVIGEFIQYIGWHILALVSIPGLMMEKPSGKRLYAVYFSSLGMVVIATLLTTVVFIPFIAQLFFWRLAPPSTVLAQTIIILAILQALTRSTDEAVVSRWIWGRRVGGVLGFTLVVFGLYRPGSISAERLGEYWYPVSLILFGGITVMFVAMYGLRRFRKVVVQNAIPVIWWALIPFAMVSLAGMRVAYWKSTVVTFDSDHQEETELFEWARTTPQEAMFVIPPGLVYFRFHAERAVVIDWFATPMAPDQILEWYRRLGVICGGNVKSRSDADRLYATMDQDRLRAVQQEFGVNSAVFRKADFHPESFDPLPIVFSNNQFIVVELK